MKRPSEFIIDSFKESFKKLKIFQNEMFSESNKIMTWLVGFSMTILVLGISNRDKIDTLYCPSTINVIMTLIFLTISFGIIFRIIFIVYQFRLTFLEVTLEQALSGHDIAIFSSTNEEIDKTDDLKQLVRSIKVDFGEDLDHLLENFDLIPSNEQETIIKSVKDYYKALGEWSEKDLKKGMEIIKHIYLEIMPLKESRINALFEAKKKDKSIIVYGWVSIISFAITAISFISLLFNLIFNLK